MIDLTPLDVRNKRGDFKKLMRGYDPAEVDIFLEAVADRLEALVRENIQLRERTSTLQAQVTSATDREQAVQDALVTAQALRADIKDQAQREADNVLKEAQVEGRRLIAEADAEVRTKLRLAERKFDGAKDALVELERRRERFLNEFRALLQRELDVVQVEEAREPLEQRAIDLDLGVDPEPEPEPEPVEPTVPLVAALRMADEPVEEVAVEEPPEEVAAAPAEPPPELVEAPLETPEASAAPAEVTPEPPTVEAAPPELPIGIDELAPQPPAEPVEPSMSIEAEAYAQATDDPADASNGVPRLEEVLAEAGADLDARPEVEEISPPPVRPPDSDDDTLLLYLDNNDG